MVNPAATQDKEIECLSPEAQKLAEARLAAKRAARAEAREIRMKELERQQKEVEERSEKDFEKGSRSLPGLSAATLASLGGTSSRRGSGDTSVSLDTEASIREIKELNELKDQIQDVEGKYMQGLKELKDSLAEVEEKYKKAMVSNAQLDNEKTNLMYQVDTLKDMLLELEEQLAESRRQLEEKSKEFEREKHAHSILQFQFAEVKEALKQKEEMLEKHGIVLNSEIAAHGGTSDILNSVEHQGSTKTTKEELNALQATGDGTLGRASEVEVTDEMVENVGKREILPNSEQEQHKEDPVKECADPEVFPPGETAEDQKTSEDSGPTPEALVNSRSEEQVQSQILESTPIPENTQQVESSEGKNMADDRPGASPEQCKCFLEPDDKIAGPVLGQDGGDVLESKNQSQESAEKQEGLQTSLEEVSTGQHQESAPVQISEVEVERASGEDTGAPSESSTEAVPEAELTGAGEQVGSEALSSPEGSDDTLTRRDTCVADAPEGSDPSPGPDLEKDFATPEVAEPSEGPAQSAEVGAEDSREEGEGRDSRDEKPVGTEAHLIPCSPAAKHSPQEAGGLSMADSESEPLDVKESDEEKSDPKGEAPGSSQKKTKSKKKKNKKKKSPAPTDTKDAQKDLAHQSPHLNEVKEEEQGKRTDEKPVVEAQVEVTKNPQQSAVAGSSENVDGPENPQTELDRKQNQADFDVNAKAENTVAGGDPLTLADDAVQSPGPSAPSAGRKGSDPGVAREEAGEGGTAPGSPPDPESEEVPGRALLPDQSPSEDISDTSQTEDAEEQAMSANPGQTVREVSDSLSPGNEDPAPAGDPEAVGSESKDERRGGNGKGRSREECTAS
uniref:LRR binding FLII interacting protein 1 n=1 Tax=Catagonus wagneri TaxID=51154 RepID=A0A8C4FFD7_9CETA